MEALLRWNHPIEGLLPPDRFIPIAEGVETKEQAEFLASRSCYLMQGYYFDRPLQAAEFEEKYLVNNGKLV